MLATGGLDAFNRFSISDLDAIGRDVHQRMQPRFRSLAPHVAVTVSVASERIIPRSDTPGAMDVGTTAFIDTMLTDWYAPADRDRFLAGIADLDARSRTTNGRVFVDRTPEAQDALLVAFDVEVNTLRRSSAAEANAHWFAMLKYLTVWGYCTSEPAMRQTLRSWPPPMRYDGCAAIEPPRTSPS
jgi:hypothetical protein